MHGASFLPWHQPEPKDPARQHYCSGTRFWAFVVGTSARFEATLHEVRMVIARCFRRQHFAKSFYFIPRSSATISFHEVTPKLESEDLIRSLLRWLWRRLITLRFYQWRRRFDLNPHCG
jgi:hypothetical protein